MPRKSRSEAKKNQLEVRVGQSGGVEYTENVMSGPTVGLASNVTINMNSLQPPGAERPGSADEPQSRIRTLEEENEQLRDALREAEKKIKRLRVASMCHEPVSRRFVIFDRTHTSRDFCQRKVALLNLPLPALVDDVRLGLAERLAMDPTTLRIQRHEGQAPEQTRVVEVCEEGRGGGGSQCQYADGSGRLWEAKEVTDTIKRVLADDKEEFPTVSGHLCNVLTVDKQEQ